MIYSVNVTNYVLCRLVYCVCSSCVNLTIYNHRYFKHLGSKRCKYYEVLTPNEFTPKQPWGSFPQDKWDELGECYPEHLRKTPNFTTHIPIYRVSHTTHDEAAMSIGSTLPQGYYTFKTRARLGKQGDLTWDETTSYGGASLGETYKQLESGEFELLQRSEASPVFPGYLSWWGIDVKPFYNTQEGNELCENINDIKRNRLYYVPDYLNERPSSRYGNNSYSLAFPDLLTSYQTARDDKPGGTVQLKVGGTLLYKQEICYVVMVGLEGDEKLQSMPSMGDYEYFSPFQHKGLINSEGVVINPQKTPNFRALYIVYKTHNQFNWEQLVFALYFPNPEQELTCQENLVQTSSVEHNFCISTQPPPNGGKWVCPNKLSREP